MQAKFRKCGFGMWPRLNADPVCNVQRGWGGICGLRRYISAGSFFSEYNQGIREKFVKLQALQKQRGNCVTVLRYATASIVKLTCSTATAICVENPGETLTPCSIVSGCSFGSWSRIYRRRRFTHTPRGPFPYRGTHPLWPLSRRGYKPVRQQSSWPRAAPRFDSGGTSCERSEQNIFLYPHFLESSGYNWKLKNEKTVTRNSVKTSYFIQKQLF